MGIFGAAHEWGGAKKVPLPKICHTYLTMMRLGTVIVHLKEIQKYIYKSRYTAFGAIIATFVEVTEQKLLGDLFG